jgi:hypothetical protein
VCCPRNSLAQPLPVLLIPAKAGIQGFLCVFHDPDFHVHTSARANDSEIVLMNLRDSILARLLCLTLFQDKKGEPMLVTDKFVFLHLPRAGGTFVYEVVTKFFPSAREIGYHFPRELLPREYSHLPILGTVRNPWEFYVSWYYHVRPRGAASTFFSWVSENGKLGFVETIQNALNLGVNDERLDDLIEMLPDHVDYGTRNIPNITKDAMRKARSTGVGYYTFRFNQLFEKADDVFFCRVDTLRQDLLTFFDGIGAASDELREYVLRLDKKNTAEYAQGSSTYYTSDLAELVQIRDRQLVERFGFTFDGYASGNRREAAA